MCAGKQAPGGVLTAVRGLGVMFSSASMSVHNRRLRWPRQRTLRSVAATALLATGLLALGGAASPAGASPIPGEST